ncbi:MAG: pyrimidine reductase family protein [Mycobacteriaceae bacterium]
MRLLLPAGESFPTSAAPTPVDDLTTEQLRALYAYPEALCRPWLRANFVSSIDGASSVDGLSAGLATPADKQVFGLLRELADVILVGAGTARAEGYRGARSRADLHDARVARGQAAVPPIAVVTAAARLDTTSPLFTDTDVPPLVLTTERADADQRELLRAAGATILIVGDERVDPRAAVAALDELGLHRVLCEGGPTLFGELISADLVDELCLTTTPVLAPGAAGRISAGMSVTPRAMTLGHALLDSDGTMLLRWVRER